jgi:hypothetical protein
MKKRRELQLICVVVYILSVVHCVTGLTLGKSGNVTRNTKKDEDHDHAVKRPTAGGWTKNTTDDGELENFCPHPNTTSNTKLGGVNLDYPITDENNTNETPLVENGAAKEQSKSIGSSFTAHNSSKGHTELNCSILNNLNFIFALGRLRSLYIDIVCLVIGTIGIIGNLTTVFIVLTNPKLRKPYFLTISTLAVADVLGICVRISGMFLEFELNIYVQCFKPSFYIFLSSYMTVDTNCILQVVLIAVMKFLLLVCPIKSRAHLRNYHITVMFFLLLFVSAGISFFWGYLVMEKVKANEDITPVSAGFAMITTAPTILAIIVLHAIKIVKLRNSPALQKDLQTMNKVVSVILGIYVLYNVQKIFLALSIAEEFFQDTIRISVLVHHACNPFIYAAFSLSSRRRNTRETRHSTRN